MIKSSEKDIRSVPGLGWATILFFIYLYLPLVILVIFSFNASRSATVWDSFTLSWYLKAITNHDIQRAAVNSLIVALSATLMATMIATTAALSLQKNQIMKGRAVVSGILMLPLMVPEIVTAVATLIFFTSIGLSLGLGNLIIAHTVFCIPFAYLPIKARLQGMNESLALAAQDLYANQRQVLRYVTLPILLPGILAGAMLAFIISIDDFLITLMVAEAGSTTLPVYIYSLIRVGITPEVNAVSTLLLIVSVLFVALSYLIARK